VPARLGVSRAGGNSPIRPKAPQGATGRPANYGRRRVHLGANLGPLGAWGGRNQALGERRVGPSCGWWWASGRRAPLASEVGRNQESAIWPISEICMPEFWSPLRASGRPVHWTHWMHWMQHWMQSRRLGAARTTD